MSKPTPSDEQLRAAVRRVYGTMCSQIHCAARGDRDVYVSDLQPERDDTLDGTWVTVRVWIADEEVR